MPIVSFSNVKPVQGAEAPTQALVTTTPLPVAAVSHTPAPQIQGDLSGTRSAIPFLALGQKSSKFCDEDPTLIGKWVYDGAVRIAPPTDPKQYSPDLPRTLGADSVLGIVTGLKVQYEEKVDFGDGIIPTVWETAAEARASGLVFRERAIMDILIAFDGGHEQQIEVGGLSFLPARFMARSTAFGKVASVVIRDSKSWLKGDLCSGWYELMPSKITGKQNTYYVPVTRPAGHVPAELRTAIREAFGV